MPINLTLCKEPVSRAENYVDAENGNIIFINPSFTPLITGDSSYQIQWNPDHYGRQDHTDSSDCGKAQGKGIVTYNMKKGTNYSAAVDFFDKEKLLNNVNADKDEIATVRTGNRMTYDYYKIKHGRNSTITKVINSSYVHYSVNYTNAF
jgi:Zn-dependent metalloprotease